MIGRDETVAGGETTLASDSAAEHGIPTLGVARSIPRMAPLLTRALEGRGEIGPHRLVDVELLRVRAGRRCVLRYTLDSADGHRALALAAKIRAKRADRRVERVGEALRSHGFREGGARRFVVAEPLGRIDPLHMNLVRWYTGTTLQQQLTCRSARPATFERTGAALAELHAASIEVERTHRLDDELAILDRDLGRAAAACPAESPRIARLLERAHAVAERIAPVPERLVHRDFHPDQILDGPCGLVLLDLDLHARSDPRVDVGNFVAHLREQALSGVTSMPTRVSSGPSWMAISRPVQHPDRRPATWSR